MAEDEKRELTEEEKAEIGAQWEEYVRTELSMLLDIYLPNSIAGNVGIKYAHPIIETNEIGEVFINEDKAVGVNISINFKFVNEIDIPKEEEPVEEE